MGAVADIYEIGSGSVTVAGVSGKSHHITRVIGWFTTTGPATGTLQLKTGSTVLWDASISGGLDLSFPSWRTITAGASVSLVLSGGQVCLMGCTDT